MRHDSQKLKKLLNAMLSLCPDIYGLVLRDGGWISINELHGAVVHEDGFGYVTPALLTQFFLINSQQYEVNGCMVRSRSACLVSPSPVESPPDVLYVAVSLKHYEVIRKNGFKGVSGRVVLFVLKELAISVVRRRFSSYVLLQIKTDMARRLGCCFYLYGESIYLSNYIPSNAIVFPQLSVSGKGDGSVLKGTAVNLAKKAPKEDCVNEFGGFFLSVTPSADLGLVKKRNGSGSRRDPDWKIARRNSRRSRGF